MTIKRISVTIPESLLVAADARATELDRSRSWVVVEAIRQLLGIRKRGPEREQEATAGVGEPGEAHGAHGAHHETRDTGRLGAYRLAQLESDLSLSPEERVQAAERTALVARLRRPRWERDRVLTFDRYEHYLDWERWEERL